MSTCHPHCIFISQQKGCYKVSMFAVRMEHIKEMENPVCYSLVTHCHAPHILRLVIMGNGQREISQGISQGPICQSQNPFVFFPCMALRKRLRQINSLGLGRGCETHFSSIFGCMKEFVQRAWVTHNSKNRTFLALLIQPHGRFEKWKKLICWISHC